MVSFNIDWDKWFTYDTVKVVKIRDKRLGLLHLVFMLAIILYIIIGVIFLQMRYLLMDTPIGSIRTTLQKPTYINPQPPYCLQTQPSYKGFPNLPCEYWDETLTVFPPSSDESLFITTRVDSSTQSTLNNCSLTQSNCTYQVVPNTSSLFYIADIVNFTILLDHTLSVPSLGIQYNARQLPGRILDHNGKEWTPPAPSVVGVKDQYDIMTVGACLDAAGLSSLDDPGLSNSSRSIRDDGMVVLVFISYSNVWSYDTSKIRYTYQFNIVKDTKYKVVEPIYTTDVSNRIIFNRHGIKFIFIQTGQLGAFDFQTMILSFVSGVGLVTISTLIVDQLAIRLLPQKERYQQLKYQEATVNSDSLLGGSLLEEAEDKSSHYQQIE